MELEKIKITDINPADYNPRSISDNEQKKLSNSIEEFGIVDPIILNLNNNKIIGGHQRFTVLQDMFDDDKELYLIRLGDVGWVFLDTDLSVKSVDHEKALNLALNKINGEWDNDKLASILEDLTLKGFNVDLTGFEHDEVISLNNMEDFSFDNEEEENEVESYEIVCPRCGHVNYL